MAWDPERYREKREKVLGVRKRGIPFSLLVVVVSFVIIGASAMVGLPGALSYLRTRHLDDAIFKLEGNGAWPPSLAAALREAQGVSQVSLDTHNTRLVVTFDRRTTRPRDFSALFTKHDLKPSLLNRVSHRQRMTTLAMEKEAEGETL